MTINNLPGMASLRDVPSIGKGYLAEILEDMGYYTVSDLRAVTERGEQNEFLRKAQHSIDNFKSVGKTAVDWFRIASKAYRIMYKIGLAEVFDADDVPKPLRCSIMGVWMTDPVITPSGYSYERQHIERWLSTMGTDPFTRDKLNVSQLVPNRALLSAINRYKPLENVYVIPHQNPSV